MCDSSVAIGSVDKEPCASAEPWSLPIDDETPLDAETQSYNIHVPGRDNNSATDEHHGYCNHADVGRPNSYDYNAYSDWRHGQNMVFWLWFLASLLVSISLIKIDPRVAHDSIACLSEEKIGVWFKDS